MKRTMIIAAALAALSAPVAAQSSSDFAVQHFNQDIDNVLDRVVLPETGASVTVSTRSIDALDKAYDVVNQSAETVFDIRGTQPVTSVSTAPAHGAEIFALLREESRENENR